MRFMCSAGVWSVAMLLTLILYGTGESREVQSGPSLPPLIQGAVTASNTVTIRGTGMVDGRDHDTSGAVIAVDGTKGVWTMDLIVMTGSATIGGTSAGVDYSPTIVPGPEIAASGQWYPL